MLDTKQAPTGITVRAARVVPARPEDVYRLMTDPSSMPTWWGKTERATLFDCEMDVRTDGRFRFGVRTQEGSEDIVSGTYVEVSPHKLALLWSSERPQDRVVHTRVTIDLLDLKDGTTRVVVTHEGLPSPSVANIYSAGWHNILQDMSLHVVGE